MAEKKKGFRGGLYDNSEEQDFYTPQFAPVDPVFDEPEPEANEGKLALASVILGAIAILTSCLWQISLPLALVAMGIGILARKRDPDAAKMANVGIILSAVALGILLISGFLGGVIKIGQKFFKLPY